VRWLDKRECEAAKVVGLYGLPLLAMAALHLRGPFG